MLCERCRWELAEWEEEEGVCGTCQITLEVRELLGQED
jgi:hypothetical protein